MASRGSDFASCISSRSVFIDHVPTFGLRAMLALRRPCFRPQPCWPFAEFQRSYPRMKSSDFPEGVVTILSGRQVARGR